MNSDSEPIIEYSIYEIVFEQYKVRGYHWSRQEMRECK